MPYARAGACTCHTLDAARPTGLAVDTGGRKAPRASSHTLLHTSCFPRSQVEITPWAGFTAAMHRANERYFADNPGAREQHERAKAMRSRPPTGDLLDTMAG